MTTPLHPLVARLVSEGGAQPIDRATLDAWLARPGERVLFFSGDPVRFPECLDVAVVLPELRAAFAGRFEVGVVLRDDEDAIAARFGARHWPSLVFLRDGLYLGTVAGMKDWDVYLRDVAAALDAPGTRVPSVGIPVVAAGATDAHACH
jgi:hydrogenase-1 operon protein HyaE